MKSYRLPQFPLFSLIKQTFHSQAGVAPIIGLFLLLVGIAAGTFIVQQQTNFLPKAAADCTQLNIGTTKNECDGNTGYTLTYSCKSIVDGDDISWKWELSDRRRATVGEQCYVDTTTAAATYCVSNGVRYAANNQPKPDGNCTAQGLICRNISATEARCTIATTARDCEVYGTGYTINPNGMCAPPQAAQSDPVKCEGRTEEEYSCSGGFKCFNLFDKVPVGDRETCRLVPSTPHYRCQANANCGTKPEGATAPAVVPPKPAAKPAQAATGSQQSTGGGGATTVVPTDASDCGQQTACVFSEGDACKVGLCSGADCGFNKNCSFQAAVDKNCISGSKYDIDSASYQPGATIDCAKGPKAGSAARAAAQAQGTTGNGQGAAPTPAATEPPTTREALYEKCGFVSKIGGLNIPLFAVGLGENQEITDEACKKLQSEQLSYFDSYLAKARDEAAEAARNKNLIYRDGQFFVDPEKENDGNRDQAIKDAKELNDTLGKTIKEAEEKVGACEGKTGQEATECLKGAQEAVQGAATAAQVQAVSNALKKLEEIIAKKRPGGCVKADMGITPHLEAQRLKRRDPNEEDRRLLLCQGSTKDNLTWRVLVGGLATGESVTKEDGTVITNTEGTDDGDSCGDKDCGNDAERIYGLHGTTPDATGDPKYPYTVEGSSGARKNSFTIVDPNVPGNVEEMLKDYIAAAKAGKTTMRGAPVEGDDGVSAPCSKGATNCGGGTGSGSGSGSSSGGGQQSGGGQAAGKCANTDQCLREHGDGWFCNSKLECEDGKGNTCTSDSYCVNKFGQGHGCIANICSIVGDTCQNDSDCSSGNKCSPNSPKRCYQPVRNDFNP